MNNEFDCSPGVGAGVKTCWYGWLKNGQALGKWGWSGWGCEADQFQFSPDNIFTSA